jgi:hypothetical protein
MKKAAGAVQSDVLNIKENAMIKQLWYLAGILIIISLAPKVGFSQSTLDTVGAKVHNAGEKTEEASEKAWDKTKEGTGKAWDKTKEGTEKAWDKTKEGTNTAVDKTKEGAKTAWHEGKKGVKKGVNWTKKESKKGWKKTKKAVHKIVKDDDEKPDAEKKNPS